MTGDTRAHPAIRRLDSAASAISAARALVAPLAGRADEHDRAGLFPVADFDDIASSGLLGVMVPTRLGGPGATFADYASVASTLGEGNGATALVFNMHASVTGALAQTPDALARALGAPDSYFVARDDILTGALDGRLYGVAMSERRAGSRLSQITTRYRRVDGGFHITGAKAFVSGAGHADAYLVAAREATSLEAPDAPDAPVRRAAAPDNPRISYFLVPSGAGVTVEQSWDALGMRATGSHDLLLDVMVGPQALLGGVEGVALLLAQVMPQWLVASYAAVYVGVARAAVDAAVAHTTERDTRRIPAVRARIGRADAAVAAAELCVAEAARRVDVAPGDPATNRWVFRAKLIAGETAAHVASSLLEAAGTSAARRGQPLERLFRDAHCGSLQPATSDVCADWLGLAATGQDPDHAAETPRW